MPPCLTLSIIRYGSRVKWSNPGKGVVPFPTPWCSSYRKGSFRVTLDYGRQLDFTNSCGVYTIFLFSLSSNRRFSSLPSCSFAMTFSLVICRCLMFLLGWTSRPHFYVHITLLLRWRPVAYITRLRIRGTSRIRASVELRPTHFSDPSPTK